MKLNKFFLILFSLTIPPIYSYERYTDGNTLIQKAPFVAHVRVEDFHETHGGNMIEYRVTVIENLKGKLPSYIHVRFPSSSKIINPGPKITAPGSEWVLILGKETKEGFYPLRSINNGKIDILTDPVSGEKILRQNIPGLNGKERKGRKWHSLGEFKEFTKNAVKKAQKEEAKGAKRKP